MLRLLGKWAWYLPKPLDKLLPERPLRPRLMAARTRAFRRESRC